MNVEYERRLVAGLCGRCGVRHPGHGRKTCRECIVQIEAAKARRAPGPRLCSTCRLREPRYTKRTCEECAARKRDDYRVAKGPLVGRVNGCKVDPTQCTRCSSPRVPGSELCAGHQQTMIELAQERYLVDEDLD